MTNSHSDVLLRVELFGGFRVWLDEQPMENFVSNKARGLFAYLFVTGKPQPRQVLAEMFWGDKPDEVANANLRVALSNLRAIAGSHLEIGRHEVGIVATARRELDVEQFLARIPPRDGFLAPRTAFDAQLMEEAVALYQGDLLDGLVVRDALSFEEWALWQRERLRQMALQGLHRLSVHHAERGNYQAALKATRRLLELEPWQEEGHRQMMLLLALTGNRSAALAQYETCRRILSAELHTQPLPETNALLERIKAMPQSSQGYASPDRARRRANLFGRQEEYAWLLDQWKQVRQEHGRLTLVEGEMGIGKTRLVEEVLHQVGASAALILRARCHEFGQDLPYQPVADMLRMALSKQPDLLKRISAVWLPHLANILPEVESSQPPGKPAADPARLAQNLTVLHLFEAVHQAFRALIAPSSPPGADPGPAGSGQARPSALRLVIFLDDLHWIDGATVDLLRYVLHRLAELPVWLVGAYQQEGLDAEHPFLRLRSALLVEDRASVLRLERLPAGAIVDWINTLPGMDLDSPERARLTEVVVQRGQGNPFITSQILRDLGELAASYHTGSSSQSVPDAAQSLREGKQPSRNGAPYMQDAPQSAPGAAESLRAAAQSQWPLQAARVPFAVREIVLLKLNRLTPAARSLLCEAAAIGEQFEVQALSPTDPDLPVAGLLAECLENGLITPSQHGLFRFVHPMMREIAAEWLTPWRRQRAGNRPLRDGALLSPGHSLQPARTGLSSESAAAGEAHSDPYALVLGAGHYAPNAA